MKNSHLDLSGKSTALSNLKGWEILFNCLLIFLGNAYKTQQGFQSEGNNKRLNFFK